MTAHPISDWLTSTELCVSCPDCAFTFDSGHTDADGGYSCPNCAEFALMRERDAIGAALGEPCAKCGHIDWRSDGYLDDLLSPVRKQYEAAQREADIQMGEKLAAQMTLKAVCDVLNLPMVSLGNGWTEATPKILARIEEIVDEAERGFRERDSWEKVAREYETALADRNLL